MSRSKSGKRGKREKLASKPLVSKMLTVPEDHHEPPPPPMAPSSSSADSNSGATWARTSAVNSWAVSDSSMGQPPAPAAAGQQPAAGFHQGLPPVPPIVPVEPVPMVQQLQTQIIQMNDQMELMRNELNAANAQNSAHTAHIAQLGRDLQAATLQQSAQVAPQRCSCCMS